MNSDKERDIFKEIFGNKEEFEKMREKIMKLLMVPKECIPDDKNKAKKNIPLFYIDRCKKCHNKMIIRIGQENHEEFNLSNSVGLPRG